MNRKDNGVNKVLIVGSGKMPEKNVLQVMQQIIREVIIIVCNLLQVIGHPLLELKEQHAEHPQLFTFGAADGDKGIQVLLYVWHQFMDVVIHRLVEIICNQTGVEEVKGVIRDVALIEIDIEH